MPGTGDSRLRAEGNRSPPQPPTPIGKYANYLQEGGDSYCLKTPPARIVSIPPSPGGSPGKENCMRIIMNSLHTLCTDDLHAAIRGMVWALADSESNEDTGLVEHTLWMLESELLNRGILPDERQVT